METAKKACMPTKISEIEHSFSELSENVANLDEDIKKLIELVELSKYTCG